ncbi:hypothetical protein CEE45_01620 [Candidatus Heimdallarchaeota archaeon B3_Heim]|nr:MAG: hypothetical protein CEE45_01620 [Candidatus Heimdallarchaeota archaeon B3_Heim]
MGLDLFFYPEEFEGPFVVLGKGETRYDKRFHQFISCMIVLDSNLNLVRLFPIDMERFSTFKEFDFVKVRIEKRNYESHRPETRKIYPSTIRYSKETFHFTLPFETGEVLHDGNWKKMHRSVALINPRELRIRQKWNEYTRIQYFCDFEGCNGHTNKLDAYTFEQVAALERENTAIGFVLGTHAGYPHRWLLVSAIRAEN